MLFTCGGSGVPSYGAIATQQWMILRNQGSFDPSMILMQRCPDRESNVHRIVLLRTTPGGVPWRPADVVEPAVRIGSDCHDATGKRIEEDAIVIALV